MKRFIVFAYDMYYPQGGIDDIVSSCDTIEEINTKCSKDYTDVIDTTTGEMYTVKDGQLKKVGNIP